MRSGAAWRFRRADSCLASCPLRRCAPPFAGDGVRAPASEAGVSAEAARERGHRIRETGVAQREAGERGFDGSLHCLAVAQPQQRHERLDTASLFYAVRVADGELAQHRCRSAHDRHFCGCPRARRERLDVGASRAQLPAAAPAQLGP
eukprot:230311-Prymnesium_polylepis.1